MATPFAVSPSAAGDATDSICPKGWEMARGSGDGGWAKLLVAVYGKNSDGSVKIDSSFVSNNYKLYDGIIYSPASILLNGGGISNRGSYGYYFSSKLASRDASISLWFYSTALYTYGSVRKGSFHSVRCVAKLTTDSICPKGWEMARYSGNGSWEKLIIETYQRINRYRNTGFAADNSLSLWPLSVYHNGYYNYNDGLYSHSQTRMLTAGFSRKLTVFILNTLETTLSAQMSTTSLNGMSVRWGGKFWSNCGVVEKGRVWYNMGRWKCVRVV